MENQSNPSKNTSDWSRTPAGMFSAAVLGIASLSGLAWSVSNSQQPIQQPTSQISPQALHQSSAPARLLIDLNTASIKELQLLPSIGPSLAQRIVNDRDEQGLYKSLSDLDRVRGIGPKTLAKLDDWVTLSAP